MPAIAALALAVNLVFFTFFTAKCREHANEHPQKNSQYMVYEKQE